MLNQRLRNLTTGRLHTKIDHVYQDIEYITGEPGIMMHMIPNALRALAAWLSEKVTDKRFWEDKHDVTHVGETDIAPMTPDERVAFFKRYEALPHPFSGKHAAKPIIIIGVRPPPDDPTTPPAT